MPQSPSSSPSPAWSATDLEHDPHQIADKAARVEKMFAAIARRYDLNNRLHSFGRDQAWRREAVRLAHVKSTDDVLDVACGTGDLTEAFAKASPRSITGLDFTQEMLDLAIAKAPKRLAADRPKPRYLRGDAMSLPFDAGSFDVVSIAFGIRNVANPAAALAEFFRVLRPGGRLVVLEFAEPPNLLLRGLNRFYTHHVMPLTATLIAGDRSGAYRYLPRSVASFVTPAALSQMVQAAGFTGVAQTSMTFGVCVVTVAHHP